MIHHRKIIARFIAVCLIAMLLSAATHAQTISTWTGGGFDDNWGTAANWLGGLPASGDNTVLVFSGSTRTSPNNSFSDWGFVIGRLEFAAGAAPFTLTGNNFGFNRYLGSQKQEILQDSTNTQTIGVNAFSFAPGADSQINLNAGDLVISSGNVYIDSQNSEVRALFVTGNDTARRTVTVAGNLNKNGGGDPDIQIQNNKRLLVTGSITTGSGNDGSIFIDDGVLEFGSTGAMTGGSPVVGAPSGSGTAAVFLNSAGSTFARQIEIRGGSSGPRIVGGLNTAGTATFSGDFVSTDSPTNYDLKAATGGTVDFTGTRNLNAGLFVNRPDGATAFGGTVRLSGSTSSTGFTALEAGALEMSDLNQIGTGHFEFNAGSGDSGTLRYSGGSATTTRTLWIDNPGITRAAIDVSQAGTTLTWNPGDGNVNQNLTKAGAGTLVFGENRITGNATVGVSAGRLVLTGSNSYSGGSTVSDGTLEVSANGSSGGSPTALGTGSVSIGSGGTVAFWLSGGGSHTITNAFSLSGGTLHTEDGYNTFSGAIVLASGASTISARYEDTITLSGGLSGSGNVLFTQTGVSGGWAAPTFVLSAGDSNTGTVRVSGSSGGGATKLQLADVNALRSATLDLAAGDTGTVEFTAAGGNTYNLGGLQGSRNLALGGKSLSVGFNGTSTTYMGNLSGSGGFTKMGSGTLTLSGSNSYAGMTSVIDGGLKLNGSIAGDLNVAQIATLSGTGMIGGNATIIGTHSPGNSPGVQTVNGNLIYVDGAVVNWELITNTTGTAGVNYDQIVLPTGNLTFSGSTTLALSFASAGSTVDWSDSFWNVNRAWTVYDLSTGATSSFSNLVLGGSLLDAQGDVLSPTERGSFTTSLSGQDVMLNFVAVPEPSTWALALAGLVCGAGMVRRRRLTRAAGL